MEVAQSTLARWERGDLWPSAVDLHGLCYVLNASEAEIVALTCCPETLAPSWEETPLSYEEARAWVRRILWRAINKEQPELMHLHFWQITARLWLLHQAWGDAGRMLLAETYAHHAYWLLGTELGSNTPRVDSARAEIIFHAEQSLATSSKALSPALIAALILARLAVYQRQRLQPLHGLELLRHWRRHQGAVVKEWKENSLLPEYVAWLLRDTAEYLALMDRTDEAIALSAQALQIAAMADNPIEKSLREHDHAELLLRAKKPHEVLRILPISTNHPRLESWGGLLRVEALYQVGQCHEAHDLLQDTLRLLEDHNLDYLAARAEQLVQLF